MIGRIVRILILIPALTIVWAFANTVGVTQNISDATGVEIPDRLRVPGLDKLLNTKDDVTTAARREALSQLRKQVRKRYGNEAARAIPEDLSASEISELLANLDDAEAFGEKLGLEVKGKKPTSKKSQPSTPAKKAPKTPKTSAPKPTKPTQTGTAVPYMNAKAYAKARTVLATLPVKGRAPMTGYDRDEFGSEWSDSAGDFVWTRNGCDTRNDVLARDLVNETFKAGTGNCKVLTGTLPYDPYTGVKNRRFDSTDDEYATDLDTEHAVALGAAWVTGAQQWSEARRAAYANDPLVLMMVDPSANRQKGDADAATWLPANKDYRCAYVSRQVAIKAKYGLWVVSAEKQAIARILASCS